MTGSTSRRLSAPEPPSTKFSWLSGAQRMSHEEFHPAPAAHYQHRAAPYPLPLQSRSQAPSSLDAHFLLHESHLTSSSTSYPYYNQSSSLYTPESDTFNALSQAYYPSSASASYLYSPPPTPETFSSSWSSRASSNFDGLSGQALAGNSGGGAWFADGGREEELTPSTSAFAAPAEDSSETAPTKAYKVMPYRSGVTPFAAKLYWMLEHPADYEGVAKWAETGHAFLIATENPTFVQRVLPDLFTHKSITSFLRQLHVYSFERLATGAQNEAQGDFSNSLVHADGNGWRAFQHAYMRRDDPSQLRLLKPKPSKARAAKKLVTARSSSEE